MVSLLIKVGKSSDSKGQKNKDIEVLDGCIGNGSTLVPLKGDD